MMDDRRVQGGKIVDDDSYISHFFSCSLFAL